MERKKRLKIRLSEEELYELHRIADQQNTSISAILRECSLGFPTERMANIYMDDMQKMTELISEIDERVTVFLLLAVNSIPERERKKIRFMKEQIDDEYGKLRSIVHEKRKNASKSISPDQTAFKKIDYLRLSDPCTKAVTVSMSDNEYEQIQKKAKRNRCPVSVMMRKNALMLYGNGRIDIKEKPLDEVNKDLQNDLLFIKTIVDSTDIPTQDETESIYELIKQVFERLKKENEGD